MHVSQRQILEYSSSEGATETIPATSKDGSCEIPVSENYGLTRSSLFPPSPNPTRPPASGLVCLPLMLRLQVAFDLTACSGVSGAPSLAVQVPGTASLVAFLCCMYLLSLFGIHVR